MKIIHSPQELQKSILNLKYSGKKIGCVPTMGALHEGHLSLIDGLRDRVDIIVLTIFVNPIQFGEGEDLDLYPRTLKRDCALAKERGVDFVFAPTASDMYPANYGTTITCGGITNRLEGAARPNHFDGVTTVVAKLFHITQPDYAIFGQKDAQQVLVIQKMVRELNMPINIVVHPIVREADGLAMSSRNSYLSESERAEVSSLYKGLLVGEFAFLGGEILSDTIKKTIEKEYEICDFFKLEYLAITDTECLPLERVSQGALLSVVCRTTESNTRLIDNIILGDL